ncbi:MFS transporter [Saccharopolyspora endophytica]|uniref:MFS transporter n=1 Tax=Saccharopolyspora endophytica TaxID=543886 RepID=A0ABS5D8L5_9PSEU|nr:MFS transporter [Saccharopolyspora endophytica]MBQ0922552.1 MFS transporter [Saccharopolyspora endophytica]
MTTELARPSLTRERGLSRSGSFWFIGGIYALFLMASTAPSPMYSIYQQRWGFTNTVLTEVFASYAVAILVALLLCGSLSDHIGRRPVLIGALVVEIAAVLVLALATGVGGLFAGRVLQGLATGAATSAISGALLDFQRPGSSQGSLVNGVAAALGMAGGSLLSGVLVQFVPGPTLTSYLLLAAGFAVAIPVVVAMPEPVAKTSSIGEALRPRRPVVPAGQGVRFALMSTMVLASWIVGGMFMSLAPSVVKGMVHDLPNLISGLPVAVLAGVGGLTQLLLARWAAERAVRVGAVLMIIAMAGIAAAVLSHHADLFFVATAVLGVGWGLMFMGAFRMLTGLAAPHQRAGTAAMIYVVAYLSATVPAVVLGYISTITDLTTATLVFTAAASLFAAIAALSTIRR